MKLLIFGTGMMIGGIVATAALCCVMINNSRFDGQKEIEAPPEPDSAETV